MLRTTGLILVVTMVLGGCDNSADVGVGTDGGIKEPEGNGLSGLPNGKVIADLSTEEAVTLCTWAGELNAQKDGSDDGAANGCGMPNGHADDLRLINAVRERSACITDLGWMETAHGCKIPVKGFEACAKAAALLPECTVPSKLPECTAEAMCVAGTANPFGYKVFEPKTRSFAAVGVNLGNYSMEAYQLSLNDSPAASEVCHLASDINAAPLNGGQQVIATLAEYPNLNQDDYCPEGSYVIRADCPATHDQSRDGFAFGPERCAYYRRFDVSGKLIGTVKATAGVIKLTQQGASCTVSVQLQFGGAGSLTDEFSFPVSKAESCSALDSPTKPAGTTCEDACERNNTDCGKSDDCSKECADRKAQAILTGCQTKLDALIACGNTAADICAPRVCEAEVEAFAMCTGAK